MPVSGDVTTQVHPIAAPPPDSHPDSIESLDQLIQHSEDPDRVSRYIREFSGAHGEVFTRVAADHQRLTWLVTVFAFSHFLSEELLRHPEWIFGITDVHSPLGDENYRSALASFLHERSVSTPTALDLALFRCRELLRLVVRDGLGFGTVAEITGELSCLADTILEAALAIVTEEVQPRYGLPIVERNDGSHSVATFAVLALGKLGGEELNYSSDIDLMFLYGDNGETSGPNKITNKEFFKKIANQLTTLLSTHTAEGLCYRVDLRLRPEGTLGDVCISLAAAKEYYAQRARDWELQMLIKARVAAGDHALGQALLDSVEPAIYSTSLDFSTIETMSATRERIAEKLARRRLRKNALDVKLAPGGIRDIEFLVQCLQRLHGGRETWVRHGGTLLALSRLHDKDLLSTTEYSRLSNAYIFLRNLEHRLQLEDDRQTHALPSEPLELERVARRMRQHARRSSAGITISAELLQDLNQHLENVQVIYDRIVHAQRPLYYSHGSITSSAGVPPVRSEPREAVSVANPSSGSLEAVAPKLTEHIRMRGVHSENRSLAAAFDNLLKVPECRELLESHPVVADAALRIFELSPYLSEQLSRFPELLEEIRRSVDHPSRRWAFEGLAAPLNDTDGLRRFFRREMFRIQAASICLPESVFQTLDRTSALAEFVIARAYRIALEKGLAHAREHTTPEKPFSDPQSEMMVVALGRLGMREFDLGSDADLLFIIPDQEAGRQRFWTRVAEHLIDILTAYTGEGTIISLDTRLRPNGREGMLVQTESKYVEYFGTKAEAWEGIAYMKARAVAGDIDRATSFLNKLQEVDWRRYGQSGRSRQNLRQMRMRLQREQSSVSPLKAGHGGYYDADFILMYLRLKGAGMFFKSLNTPERIDIVEKMGHLERADAEFLLEATTFFRAIDHAIRVVTGRSEEKIPTTPDQKQMVAELMQRWTGVQSGAANLDAELLSVQTKMRRLFETIFAQ